ncbi:nuclease-related domain protein [Andreesenia angusta]|uniref:Nuclease-related domain protein n=1 Tax=Andreesenia angusta TaxID=39480 RepID=A0A1S1VAC3_9FIRM|nr:nuclease-related domain protein [Andreesenia angusta]
MILKVLLFSIAAFMLMSFILKRILEDEEQVKKTEEAVKDKKPVETRTRPLNTGYKEDIYYDTELPYRNVSEADIKGAKGECDIFRLLKNEGESRILMNTYIKADGKPSEIDLIAINRSGIHVFESKNYSGWIFGNEKDKMWTQLLRKDKKYRFYNPIRQNRGHIGAIDSLFKGRYRDRTFSYIVFGKSCELKSVSYNPEKSVVGTLKEFNTIYRKIAQLPKLLSEGEVDYIYSTLEKLSGHNVPKSVKEEHLDYVEGLKENECQMRQ